MQIGAIHRHAKALRRDATGVEQTVWSHLRNRRLGGYKFRRQASVGYYIADFVCAEKRLIVELDGRQHGGPDDVRRTQELERLGYRVIRFWNHEVDENLDGVLQRILAECEGLPSRFMVKGKGPSSNCG